MKTSAQAAIYGSSLRAGENFSGIKGRIGGRVWGIDKKILYWDNETMMNAMKSFAFKFSSPKAICIHSDPGGAV
jgi:hypothetical protein